MKHGRTSDRPTIAVHSLSRHARSFGRPGRPYGALCGTDYTTEAGWVLTEEPTNCRRCLAALERLAEQALQDEAAITLVADAAVHRPGGGSNARHARPETVREFRRAWPKMARAVADLLRHRDVPLGDGWLGPASEAAQ